MCFHDFKPSLLFVCSKSTEFAVYQQFVVRFVFLLGCDNFQLSTGACDWSCLERLLTIQCGKPSRGLRSTNSEPDRNQSTRGRRRKWRRSGIRSGWRGPVRRGRRTAVCSSRWRSRQTSTERSAALALKACRLSGCRRWMRKVWWKHESVWRWEKMEKN